jgi:hypothetical protein
MIERPTETPPTDLTREQAEALQMITSKLQLVATGNATIEAHDAEELRHMINTAFSYYDIERLADPEGDE